jgi:hypothetical protein
MISVDQLFAHLHNVNPIADRISPACDIGQVDKSAGTPGYEDPLYGNCWSWTPAHGAAVYGRTDDLPVGPLDELANGAFLRVPFRRVPVIEVSSIKEVRAIAGSVKSRDPNIRGVWRGQSSHYTTDKKGRTKDELLRLYGAADVDEPSLLPSAARTDLYFPDSFGAWSALLDLYVHERAREQGMQRELLNFANSYRYRMWGFATAQHFGSDFGVGLSGPIVLPGEKSRLRFFDLRNVPAMVADAHANRLWEHRARFSTSARRNLTARRKSPFGQMVAGGRSGVHLSSLANPA